MEIGTKLIIEHELNGRYSEIKIPIDSKDCWMGLPPKEYFGDDN